MPNAAENLPLFGRGALPRQNRGHPAVNRPARGRWICRPGPTHLVAPQALSPATDRL